MPQTQRLQVPVLEYPHWRVNFRPVEYKAEVIPTLGACYETVEKNKVRLRGWDYPHLSYRPEERSQGSNWVASWVSFRGHLEYWRLYQSGQFLHLFSVREAVEEGWRRKLQEEAVSQVVRGDVDWQKVPGFISIDNFEYCMVEIVEFAARLSEAQVYRGNLIVSIQLEGIQGFVLTADWNRMWNMYCAAGENILGKTWTISTEDLLADSPSLSLGILVWFFERFGWMSPSEDVLRSDINNYLKTKR